MFMRTSMRGMRVRISMRVGLGRAGRVWVRAWSITMRRVSRMVTACIARAKRWTITTAASVWARSKCVRSGSIMCVVSVIGEGNRSQ